MTLLQDFKPRVAPQALPAPPCHCFKRTNFDRLSHASGSASFTLARAISLTGLAVSLLGLLLSLYRADLTGAYLLAAAGLYLISRATSQVERSSGGATFLSSISVSKLGKMAFIVRLGFCLRSHGLKRAGLPISLANGGDAKMSKAGASACASGFRWVLLLTACGVSMPILVATIWCLASANHEPVTTKRMASVACLVGRPQSGGASLQAAPALQELPVLQAPPALMAATNGTIAPQGQDATYVTGVNTCGTVKVHNLASLEALLNVVSNALEVLGLSWGVTVIIYSVVQQASLLSVTLTRVSLGSASVYLGLSTPGLINWLLASVRDANWFS